MWRQDYVVMSGRHLKNRQPTARQRSPMCFLPFGIACAAEHRNVTKVRFGHVASIRPSTKPIVVIRPMRVGDRKSPSNPHII